MPKFPRLQRLPDRRPGEAIYIHRHVKLQRGLYQSGLSAAAFIGRGPVISSELAAAERNEGKWATRETVGWYGCSNEMIERETPEDGIL